MTYFITVEELKQTTFNANLDDEYIAPALEEAQSIYLREIIGDLLYNSITSKIDEETLSGKYLTLVNQYIKPYLTYKVQSVIVIPLNNKTRNAGIINQYDQGFNTSTMKDTAYLADYYNSRAEFYANRLTTYLQKNAADFPEYGYSDDNITQPTTSQNVTGIFLGGVGKKGCGCMGTGTSTTKTVDWNNITNKPDFADVATSGDYEDLTNKPDIPSLDGYATEQWVNDQGYSTFDGDYNSLTNKPTIPAAQVNSDWYAESGVSQILHKPTLSTVATTGDYYDLDNIPTIPPAPSQADWYESDPHELSYINNKPNLGAVATSNNYYDLDNKPNLAEVATSGSYNDLTNKPTIPAAQVNSDWYAESGVSQILHKPDMNDYVLLANYNVQMQGVYNSLADKVTVGTFNSRLTEVDTELARKVNSAELCTINGERLDTRSDFELVRSDSIATVATTGNYNDLNNTPAIPTVNDATLTIKQGGVAMGTFSANANENVEINLDAGGAAQVQADWNEEDSTAVDYIKNKPTIPTVPTNVSAFTNDAGYLTQHQSLDGYATETWVQQQGYSTFDGDYNNLTNKPSIPAAPVQSNWNESDSNSLAYIQNKPSIPAAQVNADWDAVSGVAQILNKPTIPAAQVQSDWNEADTSSKAYIANKPTIPTVPTNVSAFTNDAGYTTFDGDYNSLTNKPTIPVVPTNVSAFTNDAGYLTQHQSLDGYATESWVQEQGFSTFSGSYNDLTDKPSIPTVNNAVMTIKQGGVARGTFSANANENVEINLDAGGAAQVQADWNEADTTAVDYIKNKPTIPVVPTNVSAFTNDAGYLTQHQSLDGYATETWVSQQGYSTFSGDYDDLTNKPTIPTVPTNVSAFTNDAGYTTFSGDYNDLTNKPSIPAAQVNSDWNANSGVAQILNKPSLATVATTGDYDDLTNKPTIPAAQVQTDWNAVSGMGQILNKPSLATVATTGSYSDLTNKPTIPAAPVQSDWNESNTTSLAYIANKPTIPAAQVQTDWNANSGMGEILNKPNYSSEVWTFELSGGTTVTKKVVIDLS